MNVLIALLSPSHVAHSIALEWFDAVDVFATTPVTELGLMRLSLNPRVMGQQLSPTAALASLQSLRADTRAVFVPDDTTLADPTVSTAGLVGHRQVTDLHLVNLAARHDLVLTTLDRALVDALVPADKQLVRLIG